MTSLLYPLLQFLNMIEPYFRHYRWSLRDSWWVRREGREDVMDRSAVQSRVVGFCGTRMLRQGRLAKEAAISPRTVSRIVW
jgi:hypothetical protein